MACRDKGMTICDSVLKVHRQILEFTLSSRALLLFLFNEPGYKKARYHIVKRANSRMFRGRNIGQGTC
jgi:hypothetical protein